MRPHRGGLTRSGTLQQSDEYDRVIGKILTDAAQVCAYLDAVLAQLRLRSNAGAQQKRRGMNAAGGQDHLARAKLFLLIAASHCNAGHSAAVEGETRGCRAVDEDEIFARAYRRTEVADGRRGALARPVAHRYGTIAVAKIGVH